MKKLIIFIISLLFVSQASAFSIFSQDTQIFYIWAWVKDLLPIKINIENDNEITKNNSFSLVIQDDATVRFSQDFSSLSISWSWSSKVISWLTLMPNLRVIKFKVTDDFKKGDNLVISWLKIIVYSNVQGDRWVWADLNNDWIIDYQNGNGIRVTNDNSYSDILWPSEVFNFTWSLINNKVTMSADMPWDVDFQWVQIDNLDITWKVVGSFFRYDINNFSYDLSMWVEAIRIRTVDTRANYSVWLLFPISVLKPKVEVISSSTWTLTPVVTNTGITSTWTTVSTGTVDVEEIVDTPAIEEIFMVDKYLPIFKSTSFNTFMIKFDKIIDKKAYKEEVRKARNEVITLLKKYEDKKITKTKFKIELKKTIINFVNAYKN